MSITDKDLLIQAAVAAGHLVLPDVAPQVFVRRLEDGTEMYREWQPLTDNGDAFRLAVQLRFGVKVNGSTQADWQDPDCTIVLFDSSEGAHRLNQPHEGQPEAATRRAIVRAAASIARYSGKV